MSKSALEKRVDRFLRSNAMRIANHRNSLLIVIVWLILGMVASWGVLGVLYLLSKNFV